MSKFTEGSWQRAFTAVKEQFELESLLPEQENALREFLEGRNVFVNLPTGYGKSLIFQCLPIAADALLDKPRGSSLVVVISPLKESRYLEIKPACLQLNAPLFVLAGLNDILWLFSIGGSFH